MSKLMTKTIKGIIAEDEHPLIGLSVFLSERSSREANTFWKIIEELMANGSDKEQKIATTICSRENKERFLEIKVKQKILTIINESQQPLKEMGEYLGACKKNEETAFWNVIEKLVKSGTDNEKIIAHTISSVMKK